MAKRKATEEEQIFNELATEFGGEVVSESKPVKYYIDTGNLAMNYVCAGKFIGGGIPAGRITEFYGPSASAKSLWGTSILRGIQKLNGYAILLDCENALNPEFAAKASHLDLTKLIRYTPETLEGSFAKINNVIKKIREKKGQEQPICIVYDSISVSPCERELRETDLPEEYSKETFKKIVGAKEQPGERAKIISKELRKITPVLEKNNATLFIINQTRMQVGVLYGNPEITPGGKALEFYASCRVRTSAKTKIQHKELKRPLGVNIKIANKKNRTNTPFVEIPNGPNDGGIPLYFDKGIYPLGGLLTALIQSGRITGKGGNYIVKEPWVEGKEIKFKASMAKNMVPFEVLQECPALIDANNVDEINAYFQDFEDVLNINLDDEVEIDVNEEEQNQDLLNE